MSAVRFPSAPFHNSRAVLTATVLIGLAVAGLDPAAAQPASDTEVVQELQRRLAERDAVIDQLVRRVEALEQQVGGTTAFAAPVQPTPETTVAAPAPTSPPATALDAVTAGQIGEGAGPSDAPADPTEGAAAAELTLVEQGALLLPPGTLEIEPEFIYRFDGSDRLRIVDVNGTPSVVDRDFRRDAFEGRLNARLGLPHGFQADVGIPFIHARERTVQAGVLAVEDETGFGDVEIGLTKQLMEERGSFPGLLAGIRWKAPTGEADLDGVSLGTGTHSLQGSLTAVKLLDPLVLFGSLSYTHQFEATISDRRVDRGDLFGVKLGGVLAASPEASITMAIETVFSDETRLDGTTVLGSDDVSSVFELGFGWKLSERTLLSITGGMGITESAPDLELGVALPMRF